MDKFSQHKWCFSHPWRSPGEYSFICNRPQIISFSLKFKDIAYRKANDSHMKYSLKQTLSTVRVLKQRLQIQSMQITPVMGYSLFPLKSTHYWLQCI